MRCPSSLVRINSAIELDAAFVPGLFNEKETKITSALDTGWPKQNEPRRTNFDHQLGWFDLATTYHLFLVYISVCYLLLYVVLSYQEIVSLYNFIISTHLSEVLLPNRNGNLTRMMVDKLIAFKRVALLPNPRKISHGRCPVVSHRIYHQVGNQNSHSSCPSLTWSERALSPFSRELPWAPILVSKKHIGISHHYAN